MNKSFLTIAQVFAIIAGVFFALTIIGIPIAIVNFFAASVMSNAKEGKATPNQVLGWGVALLFTAGLIGGIFAILAASSEETSTSTTSYNNQGQSLEGRIKELDALYDKGLISQEEYEQRRRKIIESV